MGFVGFDTVLVEPEERVGAPAFVVAVLDEVGVTAERDAVGRLEPVRYRALKLRPEEGFVGVGELVEYDRPRRRRLRFGVRVRSGL